MKILVAIPKSPSTFAAGPGYIVACLKQARFEVDGCLVDCAVSFARTLRVGGYDIVMTGGLCSQYWLLKDILDAARTAGATTVLGGGIVTSEPELITRALRPDYSILNQGEVTAVELARAIQAGDGDAVPGTARVTAQGKFIMAPSRPEIADLDSLPFPDHGALGFEEWLERARPSDDDYLSVFDRPRFYPLVGSRSCPFSCTFCWHPSGGRWTTRSVPNIVAEVEFAISRYGMNILYIVDELFTRNEQRLFAICEAMKKLRERHNFLWMAQCRVDGLSTAALDTMKESGCYCLSYGIESHSQVILDSMRKRITTAQIDFAFTETYKRRMAIQSSLVMGSRNETPQTAAETFAFAYRHPEVRTLALPIYVVPDSSDYRYCVAEGLISDKLDHIANHWDRPLNFASMSDREHDTMLTSIYLHNIGNNLKATIQRGRNGTVSYTCPHCGENQTLSRFTIGRLATKSVICRNCFGRVAISGLAKRFLVWLVCLLVPRVAWPYRLYRLLVLDSPSGFRKKTFSPAVQLPKCACSGTFARSCCSSGTNPSDL